MDCTPGWLVGTKWPSTLRPRPAAFYPAALPFRWRPGAEIVSKQSDRLESRSNHVHFSGRSMNLANQMQHVPRRPRGVLIAVMLLGSLLLAGPPARPAPPAGPPPPAAPPPPRACRRAARRRR